MTSFRVEHFPFSRQSIKTWAEPDGRHANWPVVYTLSSNREIYVGETLNAAGRLRQHLDAPGKKDLSAARIVIDDTFNKSVCLDLESYLIRLFAGDGKFTVINRNEGITDADYFERVRYRATFDEIFEELREAGMFTRDIPEIENNDLFKLSPFKALNQEQAITMEGILEALFADIDSGERGTIVVQGDPGTGKTIVGIFLMKLLSDIERADPTERTENDSLFSDFFMEGYVEKLKDFKIGIVIPQQSLRKSVQKVFAKTPGLEKSMVLTPFQVGESDHDFDLLVVDEAHRLNQRANQPSGALNKKFPEINMRLFGHDDLGKTQLDWIRAKSRHQVLLLDEAQSVRPADLPSHVVGPLVRDSKKQHRFYPLVSQMRVAGGADYIDFIRRMLRAEAKEPREFPGYELRMFDDLAEMHEAIRERDREHGLARLAAGYAWPWKSKNDASAVDIELDGIGLRWNTTATDWASSTNALEEVGSIHTLQGYDLNFAGVIIGPDLRLDPVSGEVVANLDRYFDKKGKEHNAQLGIRYDGDDVLQYILNIYAVLLTRGMRGTFVYISDPSLREYVRTVIRGAEP
ncbi:DNA/RNA helicase domain-containing protein [Agromyces sp. NPDC058126]|uniref:DNA/RNA helicase domain-containing protein n=1 Tax=Agromyces sp. NPDC058126 TaxID=3346350 RepID=UPI0036DCF8D9